MNQHKIIRSICYFTKHLTSDTFSMIDEAQSRLIHHNYTIQTRRICTAETSIETILSSHHDNSIYFCIGGLDRRHLKAQFDRLMGARNVSFHLDLTSRVESSDVEVLFEIIRRAPENTFNFAYMFNSCPSVPFFPCATYQEEGFTIGLQATDLAEGCDTLEAWFEQMREVWRELIDTLHERTDFLGIDSSVAPMFQGKSSLIHFMKKLYGSFSESVTTDAYLQIADFIQRENPSPIGLCGLMLPCLEDFELAEEYEAGNFPIERNLFLSMHCGLGIDTYPIGIDESPARVLDILTLLHGLATKYHKPMMARFISDGRAKIGEMARFGNPFLKDVVVRKL